LICPDCDRRTFHREEYDNNGTQQVECVACGSSESLDDRKQRSHREDPNPDRDNLVEDEGEPTDDAPAETTPATDASLSRWSR
jgi:Zn ribbon nucleic-acid-binding protein